eukprot:symbB.v1.2.035497.t1/scaffold4792.1/size39476/2
MRPCSDCTDAARSRTQCNQWILDEEKDCGCQLFSLIGSFIRRCRQFLRVFGFLCWTSEEVAIRKQCGVRPSTGCTAGHCTTGLQGSDFKIAMEMLPTLLVWQQRFGCLACDCNCVGFNPDRCSRIIAQLQLEIELFNCVHL